MINVSLAEVTCGEEMVAMAALYSLHIVVPVVYVVGEVVKDCRRVTQDVATLLGGHLKYPIIGNLQDIRQEVRLINRKLSYQAFQIHQMKYEKEYLIFCQ